MKRFLITRNLFDGDTYKCVQKFETEQEFLDWSSEKVSLGKRDWSLPKYIDENEVEQLPEGHLLVDGNPVEVAKHEDSYSYEDDDGETIIVPERDWIEYKMPDQWSYTVEDISAELALESVLKARREAYEAAGLDMDKFVEYLTENDTTKISEYRTLKATIKAQHPKP